MPNLPYSQRPEYILKAKNASRCYNDGMSVRQIINETEHSKADIYRAFQLGYSERRNLQDACLNYHQYNQQIISSEQRMKISKSMIKAHAEGRAHNIGQSRWNNEPSWPETFFMKVIDNEFDDKQYEREVPFHRFSLDFVWEHKKLVIEIDGEQHERFEDQKKRDKAKDALLIEDGYKLLRIKWKDMYSDTKYWISIAKQFIHN